jgi:hypothetical protein
MSTATTQLATRSGEPAPEHRPTEVIDGYLVDSETGEVLGLADGPERVDTPEKADAILARILRAEAQVVALDAEETALRRNIEKLRRVQWRRADWLRRRYGPELEALARKQLEGKRAKTLTLAHGSISLRTAPGSRKILNMAAAVAWMLENAPERLQVRHAVKASEALAAWDESDDSDEHGAPPWMEVTGAREVVAIKTGVRR